MVCVQYVPCMRRNMCNGFALQCFSMIPDIAAAMDEAQEEYGSRDANIQFLRTSCDEVCIATKDTGRYGKDARLSTANEGWGFLERGLGVI